jgi:predicted small metal-binding protein
MLRFECKELGTNCDYVAQGNTLEEVRRNTMEHTQTVHKYWLATRLPKQKIEIDHTLTRMTHEL